MVTDEQINEMYEAEKQRIIELSDESEFGKNLWNYYQFISWARWLNKKYLR